MSNTPTESQTAYYKKLCGWKGQQELTGLTGSQMSDEIDRLKALKSVKSEGSIPETTTLNERGHDQNCACSLCQAPEPSITRELTRDEKILTRMCQKLLFDKMPLTSIMKHDEEFDASVVNMVIRCKRGDQKVLAALIRVGL